MNELIAENSCNNLLAQPCEKIFSPPHGGMNCSGLVTDATCSFSCEPGYDLVGSQSRTCLASSRWSGKLPFCQGNCRPFSFFLKRVKLRAQLISFSNSPDVFTRTDNPFYYTTIWYTVLICRVKSLSVVPVYKSHASLSI